MEITGKTKVIGLFGYPVKHSLSPLFQNAAFQFLGLDYVYIPMEVSPENIGKAVDGIRALNFVGVNLTIPHKKTVLKYLDEIDEEAEVLGVVNTIVNKKGKLKGYTTDGCGFVRSIKESEIGFDFAGKTVFLFGAGGSAWAITGALIREKISKIYISNRTEKNAVLLKKHLSEKFGFKNVVVIPFENRNDERYWKDVHLVVNATSVGMKKGDPLLISEKNLTGSKFVYDIVYNRKTELVILAQKNGIPCLGGLSMLVYQGAVSFELWTGKKAPIEIMKKSVLLTT